MKRLLLGILAMAMSGALQANDQAVINRWKARNPGQPLPATLQVAQDAIDRRNPVKPAYPASMRKYFQQRTPEAKKAREEARVQGLEVRKIDKRAKQVQQGYPYSERLLYMPNEYVTPEMVEAYEQMQPSKVYNALPERSWKDYFNDQSGFSSDLYAAPRRGSEWFANKRRNFFKPETARALDYERALEKRVPQYGNNEYEYTKAYESEAADAAPLSWRGFRNWLGSKASNARSYIPTQMPNFRRAPANSPSYPGNYATELIDQWN